MDHGSYSSELESHAWIDLLDVIERAAEAHRHRQTARPTPAQDHDYYLLSQIALWDHLPEHEAFTRVDYDDPYGSGRFGAVPAAEAEITRLPATTAGEVRESDCAVCLERFEEGDELRTMTCPSSHGFHENCIFKWLRVSRLCPLCRFALPAEQEGNDDVEAEGDQETGAGVMLESIVAEEIDMDGDAGTGTETLIEPVEEEAGDAETLVSFYL